MERSAELSSRFPRRPGPGYHSNSMTSHLGRAWSHLRLVVLPVSLALPLAAGCGGDSESSNNAATGGASSGSGGSSNGGGFDTGLDEDKGLDDLTPDEVQQLCDKTEALVDKTLDDETLCKFMGVVAGSAALLGEAGGDLGGGGAAGAPSVPAGDPQTLCEEGTAACLADPTTGDSACTVPSDCDITVGEYEACVSDMNAMFGAAKNLLPSCDNITLASLGLLGVLVQNQPASCDVVNEKCPDALPTGGISLDEPLPSGN